MYINITIITTVAIGSDTATVGDIADAVAATAVYIATATGGRSDILVGFFCKEN